MRAAALALVTFAACGRGNFEPVTDGGRPDANPITNPPPPNYAVGTRLQPKIYRNGDTRIRFAWHDTLLDVDCAAVTMTDGVTRCVPQDASTQSFYGDNACSIPLGYRDSGLAPCSSPKFSAVQTNNVWAVRPVIGPHAGAVYNTSSGTCAVVNTGSLLDLGPELPPSMFLGSHTELTRNHDFSYTEIVFDDGSRELSDVIYDHRHEAECSLVQVSTDAAYCLPASTEYARVYFKDAACTDGVIDVQAPTDGPFLLDRDDICGDLVRIFAAGAPYAGPVYSLGQSGCVAAPDAPATYEAIPAAADEYVRFHRTIRPGSGPVREARWATDDGFDAIADNLWNEDRSGWCTTITNGDSSDLICAPWWTTLYAAYFSDATCSSSLSIALPTCVESGSAQYYPSAFSFNSCDGARFFPDIFDRPVTGPAYLLTEHGCTLVPPSTELFAPNFAIGVDAADYPAMVRE